MSQQRQADNTVWFYLQIIALVPIHTESVVSDAYMAPQAPPLDLQRLASSDAAMRCPRSSQNNVVFAIEEIRRIAGVEGHGRKSVVLL